MYQLFGSQNNYPDENIKEGDTVRCRMARGRDWTGKVYYKNGRLLQVAWDWDEDQALNWISEWDVSKVVQDAE